MPSWCRTVDDAPSQPATYDASNSSSPVLVRSVALTPIGALFEMDELRLTLDANAGPLEMVDEHPLMRVLRIHEREGEGTQSLADGVDPDASPWSAAHPEIDGGYLDAARHGVVCDSDLPVELERARLDGQRSRRRSRSFGAINDPDRHAEPRQPERQNESRRAGANDEDWGARFRHASFGFRTPARRSRWWW